MTRQFGLLASLIVIFIGTGAHAKDLSSRLGVGYRDAFPIGLPALAMHYYPNSDVGIVGALGVDTAEFNSRFGLLVGVRKIIFKEDNLNFFGGGNFSLLTVEVAGIKESGYELSGVVGSEFFLSGLDNLGFNVETGVAVTSLGKVRFRTLGDNFLRAGIIFYF